MLIGRVFYIQVLKGDFWQAQAADQRAHTSIIKAVRGVISDRNGTVLASDVPAYTVVISPKVIHERGIGEEVVTKLHELLGKPVNELQKLVEAKDKDGNYLENREVRNEGWKIDLELRDKVLAFRDELKKEHDIQETGIGIIQEQKRYYPNDTLAAHILGYTDRDGVAVAGLEALFDEKLKGVNGELDYQSDGKGYKLPDANETYKPVVNGDNLKLTIDRTIQYYIEKAMQKAYAEYQPVSMTVIAADPNTMEILGLANMPTFNPNEYMNEELSGFYNHAIKSTYEPGSTFKIVTLAGTVQEKLFNPDAKFKSGSIKIKGVKNPLHDINRSGWGEITFLEGVKRSSNVAFVKLGYEMLGKEKLMQYITDFGFGQKTGIDMPGEAQGMVDPKYEAEFATLAYGHGKVLVTPLQQLVAVSAIANGGKLMKPYVVKEITNPNTGEKTVTKPVVVRQVITKETAKETGGYLEQVVADHTIGTGRNAYIEGYRVAGKTGTAIKVEGKGYVKDKQLVSFIGYAPVNDPKIAVIVIIDEPNVELGGGALAAPVFKEIVSQSLQYMGVPKLSEENNEDGNKGEESSTKNTAPALRTTPDLTDKTMKEARALLLNKGFDFEGVGDGPTVTSQYPKAGTVLSSGQRIYLISQNGAGTSIPDLRGESLRDALEILTLLKVGIEVEGEGYVAEQVQGKKDGKTIISLKLKPLNEYGEDIPVEHSEDETETAEGT
ncbi:penicillin-binding transpeptidase domain-containing protein [Paenibacillus sp. sgz500958]|uniref:penicillin-binding transpeptidase domain-containing protein n=1 Tax=Paenibacillus sp. sgz500958 TaxID=3242475 RepID=UPI0036D3C9A7